MAAGSHRRRRILDCVIGRIEEHTPSILRSPCMPGRMIRFPVSISSIRCAAQPTILAVANRGVNSSSGMPSIRYTRPEYISTLAHTTLSLPRTDFISSGVSFSMVSRSLNSRSISLPAASAIALRFRMTARGSDRV